MRSGPAPLTSAMTSLMRLSVPSSTPFISESRTASAGSSAVHAVRLSRSVWEGTASTTSSAPSAASPGSGVARTPPGSSTPGR